MPTSPTGQHVPLEKFKQNLKDIIGHEMVKAHQPTVILITPPPVDEYALELRDLLKGSTGLTRTAEHTKKYADACRDVGSEMGSTVVDLWTAIMARAGWQAGDALPGSKTVPRNQVLRDVLRDGKSTNSAKSSFGLFVCRSTFQPPRIRSPVRGTDENDPDHRTRVRSADDSRSVSLLQGCTHVVDGMTTKLS